MTTHTQADPLRLFNRLELYARLKLDSAPEAETGEYELATGERPEHLRARWFDIDCEGTDMEAQDGTA